MRREARKNMIEGAVLCLIGMASLGSSLVLAHHMAGREPTLGVEDVRQDCREKARTLQFEVRKSGDRMELRRTSDAYRNAMDSVVDLSLLQASCQGYALDSLCVGEECKDGMFRAILKTTSVSLQEES